MAWEMVNPQSQIRGEILIGIPYKQNFSARFVGGLRGLEFPDYFAHSEMYATGQPLDITRNLMVAHGLQRNVSHIFFLDEDIILKKDTLTSLYEAHFPITGSVYYGRNPPYNVVANINGQPITREMIIEKRKASNDGRALMEIHEVGLGACLIDMRVFKRIAKFHDLPWFCSARHPDQLAEAEKDDTGIYFTNEEAINQNYRCRYCNNTIIAPFFDYRIGKYQDNSLSEDYFLMKLARQAGFSIYLSIHTEVEHEITMFTIDSNGLNNSTTSAGVML